jgi:hypothetical protein
MNDFAEPDLDEFLFRRGLLKPGESAVWTRLSGGVSSDIRRVQLPGRHQIFQFRPIDRFKSVYKIPFILFRQRRLILPVHNTSAFQF